MCRTQGQEGIPTKNLQHPQIAQDLVSREAKLAVSAPEQGIFSIPVGIFIRPWRSYDVV